MHKIILALRYFLKRRITHFAVLAVALCVLIVFVVMTIMTGLVNDFKRKNHNFVGDCVVGTESLVGFSYYEEFIKTFAKQWYSIGYTDSNNGKERDFEYHWKEAEHDIELMEEVG